MFARTREQAILTDRKRLIALLSLLVFLAIAIHLYSPADWSTLGLKLLHAMHGPGFAGLALAVFLSLKLFRRTLRNYSITVAILGIVVVVAEFAQLFAGRSAEFSDVLTDVLAVGGTLGIIAIADRQVAAKLAVPLRAAIGLVALLALYYAIAPAIWLGYVYVQQHRAMPVLLSNEHRWELEQFSPDNGHATTQRSNPPGWPTGGTKILEAQPQGQYGIFLSLHPAPDWTDYDRLSFVVASVDGPHDVMVCIRERRASPLRANKRLCRTLQVNTTPAKETIDLAGQRQNLTGESLNFSRIDAIVFSQARPGGTALLWLDDVLLEQAPAPLP